MMNLLETIFFKSSRPGLDFKAFLDIENDNDPESEGVEQLCYS